MEEPMVEIVRSGPTGAPGSYEVAWLSQLGVSAQALAQKTLEDSAVGYRQFRLIAYIQSPKIRTGEFT